MADTTDYASKKAFYNRMLTVYGRKPALEILRDPSLDIHALHLAESNRAGRIIEELRTAASNRDIPIQYHSREALSRISKNARQDQGVAIDVLCPGFRQLEDFANTLKPGARQRLLALDGISNPQNLGMIIRSAAAGKIDGIVVPAKGNATLGPLVIKASAGTVYRAPLLLCPSLQPALHTLKAKGATVLALDGAAQESLFEYKEEGVCVYVLGNETEGVSSQVRNLCDAQLFIPMQNGVESLNVAVSASLVAFAHHLER